MQNLEIGQARENNVYESSQRRLDGQDLTALNLRDFSKNTSRKTGLPPPPFG
jgi:hypothetical protein